MVVTIFGCHALEEVRVLQKPALEYSYFCDFFFIPYAYECDSHMYCLTVLSYDVHITYFVLRIS